MKKLICLCLFASLVVVQGAHAEEIRDFGVAIKLGSDASLRVIEKINYDFGSLPKYGIYRYIATTYQEGLDQHRLGISELAVPEYQFSTKQEANRLAVRIGEEGKGLKGVNFYAINYLVKGAVTYRKDYDQLNWEVTGNGWPVPINLVKAEVDLPRALEPEQVQANCYAGAAQSSEACDGVSLITNSSGLATGVSFSQKSLLANEGLSISVSLPKGVLDEPGVIERAWSFVRDNYLVLLVVGLVKVALLKSRSLIIGRLKFNK